LRYRHEFDGRNAKLFQLREMRQYCVERAVAGKHADVQFVNNEAA
jgi:hypothetical protein